MENRFKKARTEHNQHGPQSSKDVSSATGITKSLIEDLESNVGKLRNVGYLTIKELAQYYGVSTDFLLGLSETPSTKEDMKVVCKTTGLSTAAVDWLKSINDDPVQLETFNAILENRTFQATLRIINELKNVQIAAEIDRSMVKPFDITPSNELGYGQYAVGGHEYLSVLEYRIAEFLKIVIDEVTSPHLEV